MKGVDGAEALGQVKEGQNTLDIEELGRLHPTSQMLSGSLMQSTF